MNCKLCKENEADKTNSHLIPSFLLRSMVTPGEERRTEKDLSFNLSNPSQINYFIGRDLSPEKIEEALGREMTEAEIYNNSIFFVVDNLFCTQCEEKFSRIESVFSSIIFPKIKSHALTDELNSIALSETDSLILKLFSYSIIWRLAISNYEKYQLHISIVDKLDAILNLVLSTVENEITPNCIKNKELIHKHRIAISYFENEAVPNSRMVFFQKNRTNPHSYFINGLTIFFFYKQSAFSKKGNSFFGLEKSIKREDISKNDNCFVYKNSNEQMIKAMDSLSNLFIGQMLKTFKFNFEFIYTHIHKSKPEPIVIARYIGELLDVENAYADKFSLARIKALTLKYCS